MIYRLIICLIFIYCILPIDILAQQNTVKTIIVDAGHGGPDDGARGSVTTEAALNLQVATKLAKELRNEFPEIKILETRTTSALPGGLTNAVAANRYRADYANRMGGDLFIAIHCNAAGRRPGGWYEKKVVGSEPRVRLVKKGKKKVEETYYVKQYEDVYVENKTKGTETYIWAVGKNEQKVSSINKNEAYAENENGLNGGESESAGGVEMPDMNDPAEKARMLIYAQHYFRKSYALASLVERAFINQGRVSRGVQQRNNKGIWVLQATGMPSILIEIGFISNKADEDYMMSSTGQSQIVQNIVSAVKSYLGNPNAVPDEPDMSIAPIP